MLLVVSHSAIATAIITYIFNNNNNNNNNDDLATGKIVTFSFASICVFV